MRRTTTILALVMLLVALGTARATAQGIPIIFCADQEPETPECRGTDSFESLVGQDTRDVIRAFAGDDIVNAEAGDDDAFGGPGVDNMNGSFGDDWLFGGRGGDTVSDDVSGVGGEPTTGDADELSGNRGNDIISAGDGDFRDTLECGMGEEDFAFFDENRRAAATRSATTASSRTSSRGPPRLTRRPDEPSRAAFGRLYRR